jgi:hypothetical protein
MANKGQSLNNPCTGERIVFQQTEKDTGGTLVEFDHYMQPRTTPTFAEHVQLNQEERFEIVSGAARYRLNGAELQAQAGETVIVPPGAFHINCWNAGPAELQLRHSFRPALGSDFFFETMFTLAQAGKTNAKGEVNLFHLAVIGSEIESQTYTAGIPIPLQRVGLSILATLGRWLGYRAPRS